MNPTPAGVPVRITSPGSNVINLKFLINIIIVFSIVLSAYHRKKIRTAKDKRLFRGVWRWARWYCRPVSVCHSPMSSRTYCWCRIPLPWSLRPGQEDRMCPFLCQEWIDCRFASISASRAPIYPAPPYNRRYSPRRRHYWGLYISCRSLPPARPPSRLSANPKIKKRSLIGLQSSVRDFRNALYKRAAFYFFRVSRINYVMDQRWSNNQMRNPSGIRVADPARNRM